MNHNGLLKKLNRKGGFRRSAAPLALWAAGAILSFGLSAETASARVQSVRLEAVRLAGDVYGGREGNRYEERRFSTDALNRLQDRIDWAQSRGALSAREADRLHYRADDLRNRSRAYWRSGGIDRQEGRELDDRFQNLREDVRHLVWDREYRGQYRQEWRERSLWGENGWRGDGDRRQSGFNGAELKRSEFDGDDDRADLDRPDPGPEAPQAAPKQYEPPQTLAPKPLTPKPAAPKSTAPAQTNGGNQPFQDGRDFH